MSVTINGKIISGNINFGSQTFHGNVVIDGNGLTETTATEELEVTESVIDGELINGKFVDANTIVGDEDGVVRIKGDLSASNLNIGGTVYINGKRVN